MLAAIINAECSECSDIEKYLVGSVIINRLYDKRWPKTIKGVILQKRQFQGVGTKLYYPTKENIIIAKNLLNNVGRVENIYYFCTTFSKKQPMRRITIYGKFHNYGL